MQKRQLGQSTIAVSPIILGTWAIGGWMWGGSDEKASVEAIQASIEHGITAIDTAPVYGMGYSEMLVGKAIAGKRDKVILATKCGMCWRAKKPGEPFNDVDLEGNPVTIFRSLKPASIIKECEESLKRLKTDVIDLYQIHWPDSETPIEESWSAMAKLKEQGKVRALGVSNFSLEMLKQAHALHPVDTIQPPYSLIRRGIEEDLLPFCTKNKISVIVYSPMERGLLTGKILPGHTFSPNDHRAFKPSFSPENLARIQKALETIRPIASRHKASIAQIIIHCTFMRPGITAALIGARNKEQAIENAQALSLELNAAERQEIADVLSSPSLQHPIYE